jgi:hypothetical protein
MTLEGDARQTPLTDPGGVGSAEAAAVRPARPPVRARSPILPRESSTWTEGVKCRRL